MSKRYVQPGQKPVEPNTEPGKDEQSNNAVWEEDSRKGEEGRREQGKCGAKAESGRVSNQAWKRIQIEN